MRLELALQTRPALPILRDSIRQQSAPYEVALRDGSLRFSLEPRRGDWYTFYECCIRRDYLRPPVVLNPGDRVLDIGGNFGAFALMAAHRVGPTGQVHCYEPGSESFARIQHHIEINHAANVTAIHAAVGATAGKLPLYLSRKSALNSLFEAVDGREGQGEHGVEVVDVLGIKSVLARLGSPIALAKIDCEGSEYAIFDALEDEDIRTITQFAIETHKVANRHRDEIVNRLKSLDYTITGQNPFRAFRH